MNKQELIEEIEDLLEQVKDKDFIILWNKLFKEETIDSLDDSREDLQSLLVEEVEYFEISKVIKIHKYLNLKV